MSNEIHTTTDYGMFRFLNGNRTVTETRKNKLVDNIKKYGWITNPIIVNSDMEILDGQGRYLALKELKMPIEFIVAENSDINACVALNINNTRWLGKDYVEYFGANGNENYSRIVALMNEFGVSPDIVMRAANKGQYSGGSNSIARKSGEMVFTEKDYKNAEKSLKEYKKYIEIFSAHQRNKNGFISTIFYCIDYGVDVEKLRIAEEQYGNTKYHFRDTLTNLKYIEETYNFNKRAHNRISIVENYKKSSWGIKYSRKEQNNE